MDELDEKILEILMDDGRASYIEIGRRLHLSEGAVRKRIHAMVKSGVINKFTIQLGFVKGARALCLVSVSPQLPTSAVSEKIKKIPGVETVLEVTGQYDIASIISTLSIAEVNRSIETIRRVRGVTNTNTLIILRQC